VANTTGALFNLGLAPTGGDKDSSLVVAGNVVISGEKARVSTKGGFSVFGTLVTTGNREDSDYINQSGPLVAYYVNLESGGTTFGGPVTLIGDLPSNLYSKATILKNFISRGKVILTGVTLGGTMTIQSAIEFRGTDALINFSGGAFEFLPNAKITFNPLPEYKKTPVDLTSSKLSANTLYTGGANSVTFTFNEPYEGVPAGGKFNYPVIFNSSAKFTKFPDSTATDAGSVSFGSAATFNSTVEFAEGVSGSFSTVGETIFGQAVTLSDVYDTTGKAGFSGQVIFMGKATVDQATANFAGSSSFRSGLSLPQGGSFSNYAELEGEFELPTGDKNGTRYENAIIVGPNARFKYGGITVKPAEAAGWGSLSAEPGPSIKFTGGNILSVNYGALNVDNAEIALSGDAEIQVEGRSNGRIGLALSRGTVSTNAGSDEEPSVSYKLYGISNAATGTRALLQGSGGVVTLSATSITGDGAGAARPSLLFTGSSSATPYATLEVGGAGLTIEGVTVALYAPNPDAPTAGGANTGTLSVAAADIAKSPVIVLTGGVGGAAGAIVYGNAAGDKIIGNIVGNPTTPTVTPETVYKTGYIATNKSGTFASGAAGGTIDFNGAGAIVGS
jgi:hypothetical protein